MTAEIETGIVILGSTECEGVGCLVTGCEDYDEFRALPQVVSQSGRLYGRTGWNSDRQVAYYQTNARIAMEVLPGLDKD